ncbi:hypothetical protein [Microbacterium sp. YY-01]|uniref:hypothetical protein n=1 Tax=Microbacterium sp. YY-01 TaxID=3421634 RepID=UPI003D177176
MSTKLGHWPIAVRIGLVYVLARIVTTLMMVAATVFAVEGTRFGPDASLADFIVGWDAQWYWWVAVNGYPTELPTLPNGRVTENAWAFLPVFAWLAKMLGAVVGSWGAGAFLISFAAGYAAMLMLYRLMLPTIGSRAALWTVVLVSSGPLAALFQVGYAESLGLLLLLVGLWAVQRRRWWWLYLVIPVLAFTRPGILAFALFLGLYGVVRWFQRHKDPLLRSTIVHLVAAAGLATVLGFAWPVIAGVVTGTPDAYLLTELSWRRNWSHTEPQAFFPFEGWFMAARFWLSLWGLPPWLGAVVVIGLFIGTAALLFLPRRVRALGVETRLWSASYALYIFAVFYPQSSTLRLLFPLTPLWGAVVVDRSRTWRITMLVIVVAAQWLWIWNMYALGNTFWRVP